MALYDGRYPAPVLRVDEGAAVRATVLNRLPDPTTVHWHGLPVPNWTDGVPRVTQAPVAPGESFDHRFRAAPSGTYLYHSHVGLQFDRTLVGVFVVEAADPHVDVDREYVVYLDDLLTRRPAHGRFPDIPSYDGLTMNGGLPAAAPTFAADPGDRVRFRVVAAGAATTFRLRLAGHPLTVTHKDGRPVEPTDTDALVCSTAERYDAVVTARPGRWRLRASPVNADDVGDPPPALGVLDVGEGGGTATSPSEGGDALDVADLDAVERYAGVGGRPDREYRLSLGRGPRPGSWAIDGELYPEADWLDVRPNEHVRFVLDNESGMYHPMHLHGHFFVSDGVVMDTLPVGPGETRTLEFYTDNPGRWLFHCHNEYHVASGMARVVRYREG
jgi:FtsP/CotA-like multicopper oxidase with cupredoxin domain